MFQGLASRQSLQTKPIGLDLLLMLKWIVEHNQPLPLFAVQTVARMCSTRGGGAEMLHVNTTKANNHNIYYKN